MNLPGITYESNRRFSFSQRLLLAVIPPVAAATIRLLYCTCRLEVRGTGHLDAVVSDHGHVLVAFWHESMISACWLNRGCNYHTLTSHSFDGELAARVIRWFGLRAVRGSSSRGGAEGLRQLQLAAEQVARVGFTLDGPTGPRRVAKAGIGVLSARTGLPVVPLAILPQSAMRLNSWDRLPIPLPFSRVICAFGEPVPPPPSAQPADIEVMRHQVEERLNGLFASIETETAASA